MMNQRWRNGRDFYRVPDEVIRTSDYEIVTMTTEREIRQLIETHHYLKSLPPSRWRFGLYRHEQLVGAAVFSYPTNNRTITSVFGVRRLMVWNWGGCSCWMMCRETVRAGSWRNVSGGFGRRDWQGW